LLRAVLAEALGADPVDVVPVFEPDAEAHALWLVALGQPAALRLAAALEADPTAREERALAPTPAWQRGRLEVQAGGGDVFDFAIEAERDGVAELALLPRTLASIDVRETLARAGSALLGDARFGGRLVAGGLRSWSARLRLPAEGIDVACEAPAEFWPDERVFPPDAGAAAGNEAELVVSRATLRAIAKGHPWVLADTETGDAGRFRAGALVWLRAADGERNTLARVEGEGPLVARVWAPRESIRGTRTNPSVEARIAAALTRRRVLLDGATAENGSDAFRLVHGEADALPGLGIDRLGSSLRVLVTSRACAQVTTRAVDAVVHALAGSLGADPPVIEVLHLRERPAGALECVRLARGELASGLRDGSERLVVRERGLRFFVELGLGAPTRSAPGLGLFLDQRENRARLAARAAGGRWLNLFAHTGAFSAALLAAGAAEVVSVDLSAAWLRWLEETLELNALDTARSRCLRGDSRRWLEKLPAGERFDGIVLDPPTAAAAGRRFWSVRRDLEPLVESALERLVPGGCLLVCRNDRGGGRELPALVSRAAERAGIPLAAVSEAGPGADFPRLPGFPEGDPFEGLLVERAQG
jgi:23S rRNA (cytosine1962-C5)-methyltransferase